MLVALALGLAPAALRAGEAEAPVLVELFTSQGCASCPPADEFLGELRNLDDVVALSFHVNYWDYIGWEDPFATEETTQRQRAYGRRLARGQVYTPQIVVDGVTHVVGSNRGAVERSIEMARTDPRPKLDIEVALTADRELRVSLPGAHLEGSAAVWFARYDSERVTRVRKGENAGRTIRNYNIVRDVRRIGTWNGLPHEIRLPASALLSGEGGRDGCAIIVQADGHGRVLAVREIMLNGET